MAYPHPTPEVPGLWPHLRAEVAACVSPDDSSRLLEFALGIGQEQPNNGSRESDRIESVTPGHVCATCWVFSPDGEYIVLVRHRIFGWSAPGGHIELHETSRRAGLRELEEETGLTRFDITAVLHEAALVHVSDLPGDRPHRHWNVAWLYRTEMDSPLSAKEGAMWWPTADLPAGPPDLEATTRRLLELLRTSSR